MRDLATYEGEMAFEIGVKPKLELLLQNVNETVYKLL